MKCVLILLLILKIKVLYNQIVKVDLFRHPKQVPYQAEPRADFLYVIDITNNLFSIARTILNVISAHLCSKMQAKTYECVNKFVNTESKPIGWLLFHSITSKNYINFKNLMNISGGKFNYGTSS